MGRAENTVLIEAPVERVFDVISAYEKYPEFLPEMYAVRVLSRHGNVVTARFALELMMRFDYTLRLVEEAPRAIGWSLVDAKILLASSGGWRLDPAEGGGTHA